MAVFKSFFVIACGAVGGFLLLLRISLKSENFPKFEAARMPAIRFILWT